MATHEAWSDLAYVYSELIQNPLKDPRATSRTSNKRSTSGWCSPSPSPSRTEYPDRFRYVYISLFISLSLSLYLSFLSRSLSLSLSLSFFLSIYLFIFTYQYLLYFSYFALFKVVTIFCYFSWRSKISVSTSIRLQMRRSLPMKPTKYLPSGTTNK